MDSLGDINLESIFQVDVKKYMHFVLIFFLKQFFKFLLTLLVLHGLKLLISNLRETLKLGEFFDFLVNLYSPKNKQKNIVFYYAPKRSGQNWGLLSKKLFFSKWSRVLTLSGHNKKTCFQYTIY